MPLTYDDFSAGEQVQLLSGGPVMTVKEIERRKNHRTDEEIPIGIRCQWFAGKKLDSGMFVPESLEKVTGQDQKKS